MTRITEVLHMFRLAATETPHRLIYLASRGREGSSFHGLAAIAVFILAVAVAGCTNRSNHTGKQELSQSSNDPVTEGRRDQATEGFDQQTDPIGQIATLTQETKANLENPDITGPWRLMEIEGENIEGQSMMQSLQRGSGGADIWIVKKESDYTIGFFAPPDEENVGMRLSLQPHGECFHFMAGEVRGLAEIADKNLRVCYFVSAPDRLPKDFRLTRGETKVVAHFRRHIPASVVISGRKDMKVSLGTWQDTLKEGRVKVNTWPLPPNQISLIEVQASLMVNGLDLRDRYLIWCEAGEQYEIDFSDIVSPNKATRTQHYWDSCTRLLRDPPPPANNTVLTETPEMKLKRFIPQLYDLPKLGVDPIALDAWQEFANSLDLVLTNRANDTGFKIFAQSFVSASRGDMFGWAIDRMNAEEQRQDSVRQSLVKLKSAAAALTAEYNTEFSCP